MPDPVAVGLEVLDVLLSGGVRLIRVEVVGLVPEPMHQAGEKRGGLKHCLEAKKCLIQ